MGAIRPWHMVVCLLVVIGIVAVALVARPVTRDKR